MTRLLVHTVHPTRPHVVCNKHGGAIKETYGVPVEEIQRGIRAGVRKINVDTDNRLAITGAIRKAFVEKPAEFDPRYYMTPARAAMQKVCEERMKQFGQAGQAANVPIVSLDEMAKAYMSGKYGNNAKPDERSAQLKN